MPTTMHIFLDRFAVCSRTHAIVLLDQAGWHGEKALAVPAEEPSTASKACMFFFLMSCLEPKEVVEESRFSSFPQAS